MKGIKKRIRLRLSKKRLNKARQLGRLVLLLGVLPSLCLLNVKGNNLLPFAVEEKESNNSYLSLHSFDNSQSAFHVKNNVKNQLFTLELKKVLEFPALALSSQQEQIINIQTTYYSLCVISSNTNRAPPAI